MNFRSDAIFRELNPGIETQLAEFFEQLSAADYETCFHPHPLTRTEATRLANYRGKDYFTVLMDHSEIVAYGMLRGWDDGFDVPSLGIATKPDQRGRGIGRRMMQHLHEMAQRRGASRVRLTVHTNNSPAIQLYRSLGYVFAPMDDDRLVGFVSV